MMKDRNLVGFATAAATAVSGIATGIGGIGIGGGLLLGALLFNKEIEEGLDSVKDWFGNLPEALLGVDDITDPDNPAVNVIPVENLEGKSPYEVYTITASGRQANYDYERANIMNSYYIRKPDLYPRTSEGEARLIAQWHAANPPPPPFLINNLLEIQVNVRVVAARRNTNFLRWIQENDPRMITQYEGSAFEYIEDYLIDWVTFATETRLIQLTPQQPYNYMVRKNWGIQAIANYAFWSAPVDGPHTWTPPTQSP